MLLKRIVTLFLMVLFLGGCTELNFGFNVINSLVKYHFKSTEEKAAIDKKDKEDRGNILKDATTLYTLNPNSKGVHLYYMTALIFNHKLEETKAALNIYNTKYPNDSDAKSFANYLKVYESIGSKDQKDIYISLIAFNQFMNAQKLMAEDKTIKQQEASPQLPGKNESVEIANKIIEESEKTSETDPFEEIEEKGIKAVVKEEKDGTKVFTNVVNKYDENKTQKDLMKETTQNVYFEEKKQKIAEAPKKNVIAIMEKFKMNELSKLQYNLSQNELVDFQKINFQEKDKRVLEKKIWDFHKKYKSAFSAHLTAKFLIENHRIVQASKFLSDALKVYPNEISLLMDRDALNSYLRSKTEGEKIAALRNYKENLDFLNSLSNKNTQREVSSTKTPAPSAPQKKK